MAFIKYAAVAWPSKRGGSGGVLRSATATAALDAVLRLDYELGCCRDSAGSSIAVCIPLSREDWAMLERAFPAKMPLRFAAISPTAPNFT